MSFAIAIEPCYIGSWCKADSLSIEIKRSNDHSKLEVWYQHKNSSVFDCSSTSFSIDWRGFDHPEWGVESFVVENRNMMISKNAYVWRRVQSSYMLSLQEAESFRNDGYIIIREAVPKALISRAKRAIFADIGENGIPTSDLPKLRAKSFVPNLRNDSTKNGVLKDVFQHSLLPRYIKDMIGEEYDLPAVPQVAIRFPEPLDADNKVPKIRDAHIDGIETKDNGLHGDGLDSFTMLAGIALTEQDEDWNGNLAVFPGSHLRCSDVLREQHREFCSRENSEAMTGTKGGETPYVTLGPGCGAGWVSGSFTAPSIVDTISPVQLRLHAGDLVLLHYQLAHTVSPHRGEEARINLYWRIKHRKHDTNSLLIPWKDFECLI